MGTLRTGMAAAYFSLAIFPLAAQHAQMDDIEKLAIMRACEDLLVNYAFYWDARDVKSAANLFADDATFATGSGKAKGKEAIRELMENARRRQEGSTATTRHVVSNVQVTVTDRDHAEIHAYQMLYRYDPEKPEEITSLNPTLIGVLNDACVRTEEGWRYQRRNLTAVRPGTGG